MTKLERLTERLNLYYEAEKRIIGRFDDNGVFIQGTQSFTIGDTTYNRANLKQLQAEIEDLEYKIEQEQLKSKKIVKPKFFKGQFL